VSSHAGDLPQLIIVINTIGNIIGSCDKQYERSHTTVYPVRICDTGAIHLPAEIYLQHRIASIHSDYSIIRPMHSILSRSARFEFGNASALSHVPSDTWE
jgi:hypothetical protein